jgi:hypothetical protein
MSRRRVFIGGSAPAWACVGLAGLLLSGCAGMPLGDHMPLGSRSAAGPPVSHGLAAATRTTSSHRQYYDQRHQRYYFYDPGRRAYFWEDGTPKI